MADRGVVFMAYGQKIRGRPVDFWLDRARSSVQRYHPDLPVHVIRLEVPPGADEGVLVRVLAEKANLLDRSPFAETLFLDLDTVVLGDLSFGFEQARRHGMACCICEVPWARRHVALWQERDMVEYNTGVLFFTRGAQPVFRRWQELATSLDWSLVFYNYKTKTAHVMPYNDQGSFAKAVHDVGFNPYVLPLNWNFRPDFVPAYYGPLKIWHGYGDVPEPVLQGNAYYGERDSVIQFHQMWR